MRRGTKNNDFKLSVPEQKSIAGVVLESRSARIELVGKRQFVINIIIIITIIIIKSSSNIKHHFVNQMYIRWLTSLCQHKPSQQPIRYINLKRSMYIRWLTSLCQHKPSQQPIRYIKLNKIKGHLRKLTITRRRSEKERERRNMLVFHASTFLLKIFWIKCCFHL